MAGQGTQRGHRDRGTEATVTQQCALRTVCQDLLATASPEKCLICIILYVPRPAAAHACCQGPRHENYMLGCMLPNLPFSKIHFFGYPDAKYLNSQGIRTPANPSIEECLKGEHSLSPIGWPRACWLEPTIRHKWGLCSYRGLSCLG